MFVVFCTTGTADLKIVGPFDDREAAVAYEQNEAEPGSKAVEVTKPDA